MSGNERKMSVIKPQQKPMVFNTSRGAGNHPLETYQKGGLFSIYSIVTREVWENKRIKIRIKE